MVHLASHKSSVPTPMTLWGFVRSAAGKAPNEQTPPTSTLECSFQKEKSSLPQVSCKQYSNYTGALRWGGLNKRYQKDNVKLTGS